MPYPGRNRLLARGSRWAYKLRDLFSTARTPAAGVRTCEPGPGTLRFVETNGQLSISNGALVYPAQVSGALGRQGVVGPGVSRVIGRTLVGEFQWSALGGIYFAFATAARLDTASGTYIAAGFFTNGTGLRLANAGGVLPATYGTVATGTTYQLAIVLRNPGALFYYRQGTSGNWTLLWVSNTDTTATLYPILSNLTNAGTLKNLKVVDLGSPFTGQNTPTTNTLTNPTAGTTTTATADTTIDVAYTNDGTNTVELRFRKVDANNYWRVTSSGSGDLGLGVVVGGAFTSVGSLANGTVSAAAHRLRVYAQQTTYRVYVDGVLLLSYDDSSNNRHTTATGVEVNRVSGGVSSAVVRPLGPQCDQATSPAAGTRLVAPADTLIEFSYTNDGINTVELRYRLMGSADFFRFTASGSGDCALWLFKTGQSAASKTSLAGGTISAGVHRIIISVIGNVHKLYVDGVLLWTFTDANNDFPAATGVEVNRVSGGVSECYTWHQSIDLSTAIAAGSLQLSDQFTNSVTAGVYNLRAAEPGPGQWKLTDGLGVSSISGSTFQFTGNGLAWGDPALVGEAMARIPGRAMLFRTTGQNGAEAHYAGWVKAIAPFAFDYADGGSVYAVGTTSKVNNVTAQFDPSGYALSTFGRHMFVLQTTGFLYCAEVNGVWKLLWVDETKSTTPLYPALVHSHVGGAKTYSDVAVLDLPAPWATDNGAATFVASGSLSGGATAAHLPDTLAVFKLAAVAAGMTDKVVRFRKKDANNYIKYRVFDNGASCTAVLSKVVTGVETVLATYAGAFAYAATPRVTIIADGNVYRVFHNEVLASEVTDAGNSHLTEVSAEIASGTFSGLAFWPRYPPLPALL